jgi:PDZ domain
MLKARAPWWMYVIACSFFTYFCISVYLSFWGPEPLGLVADSIAGHITIRSVQPDSPASRAALRTGDQIAAVGGRVIVSVLDWFAVPYNSEAGRPISFQIVRDGKPLERTVVPNRHPSFYWKTREGISRQMVLFSELAYLAVAFWIAFSRPFSLLARLGGWFLASAGVALIYQLDGANALCRRLPGPLQALLWIQVILSRFGLGVFFTFCAIFPRALFRARWIWILSWIRILAFLPWELQYIFHATYEPNEPPRASEWITLAVPIYWLFYVPLGLLMLFVNYKGLTDLTERRRVRVIVAGLAVTVFMSLPSYVATMPGVSGTGLDVFLGSRFGEGSFSKVNVSAYGVRKLCRPVRGDIDCLLARTPLSTKYRQVTIRGAV